MQNNHLIIFSRTPVLGTVKTRIAEHLGAGNALALHEWLFKSTLNTCKSTGSPYTIYFSEPSKTALQVPAKIQAGKNLGERMHNAFDAELVNAGKVIIIGIDCPTLTPEDIAEAFDQLDLVDVVFGPAADGGYYLIGLKDPFPELFSGISWGTSKVLEQSLAVCARHNYTANLLRLQKDIDRVEDLPADWLSFWRHYILLC